MTLEETLDVIEIGEQIYLVDLYENLISEGDKDGLDLPEGWEYWDVITIFTREEKVNGRIEAVKIEIMVDKDFRD